MCPAPAGRQARPHDLLPLADPVIAARDLTKTYGTKTAVDGITFTVEPGRVTGFLGPNGAGKSTTMRMILGLDRPSAGSVTVNGRRYADSPAPLREVGALLEARALHPGRSARDHLRWLAVSNAIPAARVDAVLGLVGLEAVAGQRVGKFSLGMGQRLGIAVALLGDPPVVVLDEPVNGLDPEGIRWVRTLARQLADEGRTVFVSSHLMSEMALTADHLVVIGRGTVLADCSTTEFIADHASSYVRVRSPQRGEVADLLRRSGLDVAAQDDELRVQGLDAAAVGELIGRSGLYLHELTLVRSSLEDAFMTLTADSVEYSAHDLAATPAGSTR
jgi:ABC-2 type transport system ATP-binding protein